MDPKKILIGVVVLAIIGVAVIQLGNNGTGINQKPQTIQGQPTVTVEVMKKSKYADGQYTAIGNYISPAQREEIEITLTLKDGVVTDAAFTGKATHEKSMAMQRLFSEGYKEQVVGKPINEIALTVVNGSSLTPKGFMDALQKIKTEAVQS
ncbi:hypothetical protein COU89_02130 [Candidatus Roizmanbacteria bacterium CG10_big_fil_rev_8_21_14_0_10_45_7]|uniref:FMN-binding domain-containing protein n=1 Tax=Candidatus Roizmanbacteria bacterium CG10_big_fil_rev_8_21_14_0_10_45_7 TaxID=1974854 RepID=A0A2M8KUU6_9BACT|nr:MAG: hypothetical protein COU89_02130 [Candidatus Roizmanbacteria bacterium CG10_big_fil_rev_8_21_14_0_10_45_7]